MYLKIEGPTTLDYWKVYQKVLKRNEHVDHLILDAYYDLAPAWGMDAAALISQAIHETGWFTSYRSVVNHNYAGIGATSDSVIGKVNKCIIEGVQNHYAHWQAYNGDMYDKLAAAYDDRYDIIQAMRGPARKKLAPYMEQVGGIWAPAKDYGYKVVKVYETLKAAA